MDNTTAKYSVEVTREGNGANEAAQQFRKLEEAAISARNAVNNVNNPTTVVTNSFTGLRQTTVATRAALANLSNVGSILGLTTIPQVTTSALVLTSTMSSLRAVAVASGAGLGMIGAALASLVAVLAAASTGWDAYKAKQEEAASSWDLYNQQIDLRKRMLESIAKYEGQGYLGAGTYTAASVDLWADDDPAVVTKKLRTWREKVMALVPTADQDKAIAQLSKLYDDMIARTLDGFEKERFEANRTFKERRAQLAELAAKAGYKDEQVDRVLAKATAEDKMVMDRIAAREREEIARKEREAQAEIARQANQEIEALERNLTLQALEQGGSRTEIAEREYARRRELATRLYEEGKIDEERTTQLYEEAQIKRLSLEQKVERESRLRIMSIVDMQVSAAESFATNMSQAFVSFAAGTASAEQAFRQFGASFLQQVSQMIMQMLILKAIQGVFPGIGTTPVVGAGAAANGGMFPRYAASGLSGVYPVSTATYLPRFNVVAGEAGREMLTVLARPRFMNLGGISAVVGKAAGQDLAISPASDLSRTASGRVVIELTHSDESKARIIEQSINGAEVRVTQRLNQHSTLREAVKRASS